MRHQAAVVRLSRIGFQNDAVSGCGAVSSGNSRLASPAQQSPQPAMPPQDGSPMSAFIVSPQVSQTRSGRLQHLQHRRSQSHSAHVSGSPPPFITPHDLPNPFHHTRIARVVWEGALRRRVFRSGILLVKNCRGKMPNAILACLTSFRDSV